MTLATLSTLLPEANARGHAIAGLVCLGWEDMRAYVAACEAEGVPGILQAGPGCRAHTPLPVLAAMMRHLAAPASVPIAVHLDHGYTAEECREAIDCGFTSVMFDGSKLPLEDNIAQTRAIVDMAHAAGVSCEGEIGFVGYAAGAASKGTDPAEAARFAAETGVDAMAISVGNTHLQTEAGAGLDAARIRAIEAVTEGPLVIHGGSGVPHAQRAHLAATSRIAKFNIGTELRQAFGTALRHAVLSDPDEFDRVALLKQTHDPVVAATRAVLRSVTPGPLSSGTSSS